MIHVEFRNSNIYASSVTGTLWQYDYGQALRIQGLTLPAAVQIHFSLQETGGESVTRVGVTKDGVTDVPIPDSMMENNGTNRDYKIYAFIYLTDDSSGETIRKIVMPVRSRPKPEAFDTPEDAELFREAIAVVNETVENAKKELTPTIGENGNWFIGGEDTGVQSVGKDGDTPYIGENGNWFIGDVDTGKPSVGTGGGVWPDWNQNDETAQDYVKNRPFYESDPVDTVLMEETTISEWEDWSDDTITIYGCYIENLTVVIEKDVKYIIEWDGVTYNLVGFIDSYDYIAIGNNKYTIGTDTGEPFLIEYDSKYDCTYLLASDNAAHTIKITGFIADVHKLDNKFIDFDKDIASGSNKPASCYTIGNYVQDCLRPIQSSIAEVTPLVFRYNIMNNKITINKSVTTAFDIAESYRTGYKTARKRTPVYYEVGTNDMSISQGAHHCLAYQKSTYEDENACFAYFIDPMFTYESKYGYNKLIIFILKESGTIIKQEVNLIDQRMLDKMIVSDGVFLKSSTSGSSKRFKITVDDTGAITTTEVTE